MLKPTRSSEANRNLHEAFTRVLKSFNRRLQRNALPLGLSALAAVSIAQTGCSSSFRSLSNELNNSLLVEYRDAIWSRRAYNLRYGNCDRPFASHYRDGFCAGYMDVSNGGDGYVPALPPPEYRGFEYQSAEGAKCVNTWFEGYPAGVAAAKQDKTGEYKDMFISKMINSAVTQDKARHSLPSDVPIIKSNAGTNGPSDVTGVTNEAPPVPSVTQYYGPSPAINGPSEIALTGPQSANDEAYAKAISVVESSLPQTETWDEVTPVLPPIVQGRSNPAPQPTQFTAPRPSEASPHPVPIVRHADASVLSNQYTR